MEKWDEGDGNFFFQDSYTFNLSPMITWSTHKITPNDGHIHHSHTKQMICTQDHITTSSFSSNKTLSFVLIKGACQLSGSVCLFPLPKVRSHIHTQSTWWWWWYTSTKPDPSWFILWPRENRNASSMCFIIYVPKCTKIKMSMEFVLTRNQIL